MEVKEESVPYDGDHVTLPGQMIWYVKTLKETFNFNQSVCHEAFRAIFKSRHF